jgi:heptaprenyl diphosphate synthase
VQQAHEGQGRNSNRMFPLAVLGALTGDPEPAVPVGVVSTVWWAGAEALDDLSDVMAGAVPVSLTGLTPTELLIGGVACLELIPRQFIDRCPLPDDVRSAWSAEMIAASVAAASGQLADVARDAGALGWARVMATYVGKTGAAYARDAVMAAQLVTHDAATIGAWRAFGQLFGVLRQMRNDNAQANPEHDEDLANGTPTLLLAHALETGTPARTAELLELRAAARRSVEARAALRHLLHAPDIASGYTGKLHAAYHLACSLLDSVAGPSIYRDALRSRMGATVRLAAPQPTETRQR